MRIVVDGGRLPGMNAELTGGEEADALRADAVLGGRYRLLGPVGAGGMAVVWQAWDTVLARPVAVKVLGGRFAGDGAQRDLIRQEARAAAGLSHPNIAHVHDYGESQVGDETIPYIVMELVRGDTLHQRLAAGPVTPRFAMRIGAEVGAALAAAHADGLVHRDIKPANVMLAPTGAKVVDFGIAAAVRPHGSGQDEFEVLGTPAYLAPERLSDDAVEPASDVYALGVLVYRMLAGRSPWTTETTTQMLSAHIYVEPEPLPPTVGVPDHVVALCNRCLSKDPSLRPSAREAAALLAHGAGLPVVTDEPAPDGAATELEAEPSVLIRPAPADRDGDVVEAVAVPGVPDERSGPVASPNGRRAGRLPWVVAAAVLLLTLAGAVLWLVHTGDPVANATALPPSAGGSAAAPTSAGARPAGSAAAPAGTPGGAAVAAGGPVTPPAAAGATTVTVVPGGGPPAATTPAATATAATPTTPAPSATHTTATTTPEPPAEERTLSSAGGSVRATCTAPARAKLLSWTPAKSYHLGAVNPGPGSAPAVSFIHGKDVVTMTVTCSGGVPSADVDRSIAS
jgi:hypothetical protein